MALLSPRVSARAAYHSFFPLGERDQAKQNPGPPRGVSLSLKRRGVKKRKQLKGSAGRDCSVASEATGEEQPRDAFRLSGAQEKRKPKRNNRSTCKYVAALQSRQKALRRKAERRRGDQKAPEPPAASASLPQGEGGPFYSRELSSSCSLLSLLQDLEKVRDSRERAAQLFQWLIAPVSSQEFFHRYWEKSPLLIHRHNPSYYQDLFSTAEFDNILRNHSVQFGVNLDVTSYEDGKRETHNPVGRAVPAVVWDFYRNGCSLRMLNPQAFSVTVWHFLSILQEQFSTMVGANTYLTPAGAQGFAPHYDDIEAFVIQLEGKKHWRVYAPRQPDEMLPRFSSSNFSQMEIGEPILETVLEAGDLLYFPRGFIHQGDCLPEAHSLHITVSSYQQNSWGDLLEKLLPAALQMAIEEDIEYRQGLPADYLEYMGVINTDAEDPRRTVFLQKIRTLVTKLMDYAPVDAAVDQKAKSFFHDCLPPVLTETEKALSVLRHPARWENGNVQNVDIQLEKTTQICLLRYGIVRLCNEGDATLLYYTTENSRVYHKEEPKYCEIESEYIDGIEFLVSSYPNYICVSALPCGSLNDKIALATFLFEKGLLITKKPLSSCNIKINEL
ncbi:PREDICTED: bifunctional lysine-specific demethylase and histidyl-hydroxylase NO66 [Thamnophis sirtalis]|uniref:Bifunctional lysine-specific demethylase and histidyl-hydroxylase n=1 Tax=Thamnophis sirtalis TaxID=35019 RepID=A0A6I9X9U4_9SAUR|nr:PREDICTED: bifunctional lysine-specific demethylase and histidyl-hydroxylase NO66 [Thamnophis sirtalis]